MHALGQKADFLSWAPWSTLDGMPVCPFGTP